MIDKLIPPPHQITIAPGGNYIAGLWLALVVVVTLALSVVALPFAHALDFIKHLFGSIWVAGQYLGYALFGHVRYEDITPEQWVKQGVVAKFKRSRQVD